MNKLLKMLTVWSKVFKQYVGNKDKPSLPPEEVRKLRAKLILEECLETLEGLGFEVEWTSAHCQKITKDNIALYACKSDLEKTVDGCIDSIWVLLGTLVACGITKGCSIFDRLFKSNMSKLWTWEEVQEHFYLESQSQLCKIPLTKLCSVGEFWVAPSKWKVEKVTLSNRCFLVTNEYGKVVKSPSYQSLQIKDLI